MQKRKSVASVLDTAARVKAGDRLGNGESGETRTTGINVPADVHALLRAVSLKRAKEKGGRPSVSAVIVDLVRMREDELRREAGKYMDLIDLL